MTLSMRLPSKAGAWERPVGDVAPWMSDAACGGLGEMFTSDEAKGDTPVAVECRDICQVCWVRDQCRAYVDEFEGLRRDPQAVAGIYAGEDGPQRIARRNRAARKAGKR